MTEQDTDPERIRSWQTPPELWSKLKPEARRMRRKPTGAERQLWQQLRNRQVRGLKFRRQHPIGRFIVDFYCTEARLIVELDGPIHESSVDEDAARQRDIEGQGLRVLRFTNAEVEESIGDVLNRIVAALD